MNIWIVAAADDASFANIPKSLTRPIPSDVLSRGGVSYQGDVYAWGAKNGQNNFTNVLDVMKPGDLCLFYTKSESDPDKKYNWAARVKGVKQSKQLSSDIWGTDLFELVYFLDKPGAVNVSRARINKALGYDADYFPRGLMRPNISNEQLRAVQELLGAGGSRPDHQTAEVAAKEIEVSKLLDEATAAIAKTGFRFEPTQLRRFVCALAAKPFIILTGNSGTGKTKLAQLFAHWLTGGPEEALNGYAVVPVGADWTDNRNIVGFVNHLRKDGDENPVYQGTPVLDLLLRARGQPNRPFFLILDEMNLSHVERYFADFLSAMESHKPVPLHGEAGPLKTAQAAIVETTVPFPENLFVIGTVNVDETTYMFSPKVLDRANVIEFRVTEEEAKSFLSAGAMGLTQVTPAPVGYAEAFGRLCRNARTTPVPDLALAREQNDPPSAAYKQLEKCKLTLQQLLSVLRLARQEFAYRTMAEVLRYVHLDFELATKRKDWKWEDCMDAQILQKILPKLHGSKKRIGPLLVALAKYCEQGDVEEASRLAREEKNPETFKATNKDRFATPKFPLSYEKLCEMVLAVRRDQFVSFIQ